MQFVENGPDIPNTLLQAHEEGRVVFFCGAGISYPAGLPGFDGLVKKIYAEVGTDPTLIEDEAFGRNQFDATLDLLERRVTGGRHAVRSALAASLKPNLKLKNARATHEALIELSIHSDEACRLVTTNFDHIFIKAAKKLGRKIEGYNAPLLPIAKRSRWNGIVYLHGLLPADNNETDLNRLIVTSGDFGIAYLTERWAARFVTELFQNYVVCFVGYSINDPVLRYMMDALAADRMLGETTPVAYAFGDVEPGREADKKIEWGAKGVTPILYTVEAGTHNHDGLHKTLQAWASTYRDGLSGKEQIVTSYATIAPSRSTVQDDFVGRLTWALSDLSGVPAKMFAEHNPVPSLDWLSPFSDERYAHADLKQFGVSPRAQIDSGLKFSLINRPCCYSLSPRMTLVNFEQQSTQWDNVMRQLARWLVRHLDDPNLLIWVASQGGKLHRTFAQEIEAELERQQRLIDGGQQTELDELRLHAPNAFARPVYRILWRLLLAQRAKIQGLSLDLYGWATQLNSTGLNSALKFELRNHLAPNILIRRKSRYYSEDEQDGESEISPLGPIAIDLVLASDHVATALEEISKNEKWDEAQGQLLSDFERLLLDALSIADDIGISNETEDRSWFDLPSISPHWQNRGYSDWVVLIELVRDAWLKINEKSASEAAAIATRWSSLPHPTFVRLAYFAAANCSEIDGDTVIEWLSLRDGWWLWSVETKREVMRLIVTRGPDISNEGLNALETAIVAGPPRAMYREDVTDEEFKEETDHQIWLRLAKLEHSGATLSGAAEDIMNAIHESSPRLKLSESEQDEFSVWMSGTGDPDYEDKRQINTAPTELSELITWLRTTEPRRDFDYEDTWRDLCRQNFSVTFSALLHLSGEGVWPTERWKSALQAWSDTQQAASWQHAAQTVVNLPDHVFDEIARNVAWWFDAASRLIDGPSDLTFQMARRILDHGWQDEPSTDAVFNAINHPVGITTQALINLWFKTGPNDGDLLSGEFRELFTRLTDENIGAFKHARTIMAMHLIALYRVDRNWTQMCLLSYFTWSDSNPEAFSVWRGFLRSPRLHWPLLEQIKRPLLATAEHYDELSDYGRQYAAFIAHASLDPSDGFKRREFAEAFAKLPLSGIEEAVRTLLNAIKSAGDKSEQYWGNRLKPFWHDIWPKSQFDVSNALASQIALLTIAAGDAFPDALATVGPWLKPLDQIHYISGQIIEAGLPAKFPVEVIDLLHKIANGQTYISPNIRGILQVCLAGEPKLARRVKYKELDRLAREKGH